MSQNSTVSRSKKKMREAENALLRMEKFAVLSHTLTGHHMRKPFVDQAWQNVLFNQFHDAMGGCSVEEVMDDVIVQLDESISAAAREENGALQRISWQIDTMKGLPHPLRSKEENHALWGIRGQGTPVVVFNPHEFEAETTVQIRQPIRMVRDDHGALIPVQTVRASRTNNNDCSDGIFRARVPALGYKLYWVFLEQENETISTPLSASETHLENEFISAKFDPDTGALCSLISKENGQNLLSSSLETRLMDVSHCDTWAHGVFAFDRVCGSFGNAQVKLLENGPVRAKLRVRTVHETSVQEIIYTLHAGQKTLDMDVRLKLNEKHRMVKLCIPTIFKDGQDISEIPYGVLKRTACGNEEPCQRYIAMQGQDGGVALINNGRYSYSAENGELRLTLAHTAIYADHYGQKLRDDTCRYMDQEEMSVSLRLVPYKGEWQQAQLHRQAALLNQSFPFVVETYHKGKLPGELCAISIDTPCIQLGSLKEAEAENGIILRLIESTGKQTTASIMLPLLKRSEELVFTPFEIKTIFVPFDPEQPCRSMLLTELE